MKRVLLFAITFCLALGSLRAADIVFASYNLENYLLGEHDGTSPKTEHAIAAEVSIIKAIHPDILGVCELGVRSDFEDLKARLQKAGLGLTDSEYVEAADPDRHLALVSRFPIIARQSVTDAPYELNGQPEKVRRGFLDVTIQVAPDFRLRMVGVHLKSKLPIPEGDGLVRRYEAQLLRKHLDAILAADPQTNLVCYGDFNDTKNEPMYQEVVGVKGSPLHMADLPARDELGDRWTQYWKVADLYSRIDYIFVSRALFPQIAAGKSRVYRSENWYEASDHRAVFATIIPARKK